MVSGAEGQRGAGCWDATAMWRNAVGATMANLDDLSTEQAGLILSTLELQILSVDRSDHFRACTQAQSNRRRYLARCSCRPDQSAL